MADTNIPKEPQLAMNNTVRWGLSLPFAVLMTLGLGVTMAGLIAVEFVPQDKRAVITADINPVVEDIDELRLITPPERLREIDVPPPPPIVNASKSSPVKLSPIAPKVVILEFGLDDLISARNTALNIDVEYHPLVRIPPIMPNNAQRSGHCKVRFDVSAQGRPFNVEAVYCSENLFARNTIKSVKKWKYLPKTVDGTPITVTGVQNIVRFRLTDERGRIIPQ